MNVRRIDDPKTPIGDLLRSAQAEGVLVESADEGRYVLLPLEDDLIDYLLEHNPRLIAECAEIRQQMHAGSWRSHEQVRKLLDPGD